MAELVIRYLGEFEVLRDGEALPLPPSRKTRALLAFLSLNPRKFRRDYLCELLWEIPDDPRGSLRWSLSKLRRLVDDDDRARIVADRTHVEVDTTGIDIDALELRSLVNGDLAAVSTEDMEDAAARLRGNFLEGLDLPNFHDFHAWCIAEREQVARAQAALLQALVARLVDQPERALPHARALVGISPYDEASRAMLIRLLASIGHTDEAEQQYQLGSRMLKEAGIVPSGAMAAARKPQQPATEQVPDAGSARPVAVADPGTGPSSGLIGRDREASELAGLFRAVQEEGNACFALVRGEPGIGKTRLIDAAVALASGGGAAVLSSRAYEPESIRPFALWIDALQRHDAEAAAKIFADREAGNRDLLFERLSEYVSAQSQQSPLVLVFDDIHWCDDSSAAAIHYVARMNRDKPVLLIMASRDSEMRDNVPAQQLVSGLRHDQSLAEIQLGPLSEDELADLISARAPGVAAGKLSRQCGGNPLLAVELARAEQEGDSSTSVTELVRERLARISIDGTEVLQWAAVLSPHIDVGTIATLSGIDADRVGEVLEAAERQGMLTAGAGGVNYSHDMLVRAVYTTLSPLRRQVMHRRVADMLEKNAATDLGRAADLAHHAAQSGDAGLEARAMVSAGRMCLRFYANEEALSLVKRGMQLIDQLAEAERVCVAIDLHDVRLAAGPLDDWQSSAREYATLAEQALDMGELTHARLGYHMAAYVRWAHGQWAYAREESLQSERAARSASEEDQIIGMAQTAKCLVMIERDLSKADALLMEADALASRKGVRHFAIPAAQGMLRFHENRMEEAEELFKESRTLCKSAGERIDEYQANEYLAMIEIQRGRYEEARTYCEVLEEIGRKLRVGSEEPFAKALTAFCDYALNDTVEELEAAIENLRIVDAKHRLAYVLTRTAQLDCERGRMDSAGQRATEALGYAVLLQRASEMIVARTILSCVCRERNDLQALAEHDAAIAGLEDAGVAAWAEAYIRQAEELKKVAQQ